MRVEPRNDPLRKRDALPLGLLDPARFIAGVDSDVEVRFGPLVGGQGWAPALRRCHQYVL